MPTDKKRLRGPKAKPGELVMKWGKIRGEAPDMCYAYNGDSKREDARLLHYELATKKPDPFAKEPFANMLPSFLEKLEARGYDLTTFKLTVSKKNV